MKAWGQGKLKEYLAPDLAIIDGETDDENDDNTVKGASRWMDGVPDAYNHTLNGSMDPQTTYDLFRALKGFIQSPTHVC